MRFKTIFAALLLGCGIASADVESMSRSSDCVDCVSESTCWTCDTNTICSNVVYEVEYNDSIEFYDATPTNEWDGRICPHDESAMSGGSTTDGGTNLQIFVRQECKYWDAVSGTWVMSEPGPWVWDGNSLLITGSGTVTVHKTAIANQIFGTVNGLVRIGTNASQNIFQLRHLGSGVADFFGPMFGSHMVLTVSYSTELTRSAHVGPNVQRSYVAMIADDDPTDSFSVGPNIISSEVVRDSDEGNEDFFVQNAYSSRISLYSDTGKNMYINYFYVGDVTNVSIHAMGFAETTMAISNCANINITGYTNLDGVINFSYP